LNGFYCNVKDQNLLPLIGARGGRPPRDGLFLRSLHSGDLSFNAFEFSFEMFLIIGQAKQRLIFADTVTDATAAAV
jgi:hypothetical protein